jgi:LysR family transcriptional regulator of abg operon
MPLKLHHLRDLLAIAETGSINAAARHLGMGQPALSRSIRDLERELGAPLLERHARGAVLTPVGTLFARRAMVAVNELRRGRDEIQQMQGSVHGTVVACLSSLAHMALLPDALRPFTVRYPNVQIRLIEGVYPVVESQLKNGAIDFYVGPAPETGPAPELQLEKLFDNTRVVLARRGHPLGMARSLSELAEVQWVTTRITSFDEKELGDIFARRGLPPPRLGLSAETALSWMTAVAYTDMMSVSPRQWTQSPLVTNLLVPVPINEVIEAAPIVLIHRAAVPPTPAAEYFCNLIRRAAAAMARFSVDDAVRDTRRGRSRP